MRRVTRANHCIRVAKTDKRRGDEAQREDSQNDSQPQRRPRLRCAPQLNPGFVNYEVADEQNRLHDGDKDRDLGSQSDGSSTERCREREAGSPHTCRIARRKFPPRALDAGRFS